MGNIRLDGQVALVTGAGRGLGRAYALELARKGATVVVHDAGVGRDGVGKDPAVADAVVEEISREGALAVAAYQDLSTAAACVSLVHEVTHRFGRLDVLINNAGIVVFEPTGQIEPEGFDRIFAINAASSLWTTQAAIPWMERQGYGRIVLTTSGHGLTPSPGPNDLVAYGMSKAAVFGLMNQLAGSFGDSDIHVNCIAPVAATRVFTRQVGEDEYTSEQVAPGVVFLASQACSQSGIVLSSANGRFSIRMSHRSEGVDFGPNPVSAEHIRDRWHEITGE